MSDSMHTFLVKVYNHDPTAGNCAGQRPLPGGSNKLVLLGRMQ